MKEKRTALVTGASGGLGLAFARLLAEEKHDLVLVARSEAKLNSLKRELEEEHGITAWVCSVDLSRKGAALEVLRFTQANNLMIDVLINNAGFGDQGSFADCDWQKQEEMVQVDIIALMQLTHLYLPEMIRCGEGRILNLSSVAAFCAGPGMSVYYASKAFVRSFSEAVAEEVRGTGVTVTAICPGPTSTGFAAAADMGSGSRMFRRAAKPEDVARAGLRALQRGRALSYPGVFTKGMSLLSRLVPRAVSRRFAAMMDR